MPDILLNFFPVYILIWPHSISVGGDSLNLRVLPRQYFVVNGSNPNPAFPLELPVDIQYPLAPETFFQDTLLHGPLTASATARAFPSSAFAENGEDTAP